MICTASAILLELAQERAHLLTWQTREGVVDDQRHRARERDVAHRGEPAQQVELHRFLAGVTFDIVDRHSEARTRSTGGAGTRFLLGQLGGDPHESGGGHGVHLCRGIDERLARLDSFRGLVLFFDRSGQLGFERSHVLGGELDRDRRLDAA